MEYLDEVGAFPAPAPILFTGGTSNRYAQITNWTTFDGGLSTGSHWQPSRFDEAQINSGAVVLDAIGQHAGTLRLGANVSLDIIDGWLAVEDELVIGSAGTNASVNLSGGLLRTSVLNKHETGVFNFTGGVLEVDQVNFDLLVNGGTLAGSSTDNQSDVHGDLTIASGAIQIQLQSSSVADAIVVHGDLALGGILNIVPLGGFSPAPGSNWEIISANNISGQFNSISPGYDVRREGNTLRLFFGDAPAALAGDYNDDSIVDAADYVVWRKALTSGTGLPNETASVGVVDAEDYAQWRANFGAVANNATGAGAAIPEPSAAAIILLLLVQQAFQRRAIY
jgi:hypothetical protein